MKDPKTEKVATPTSDPFTGQDSGLLPDEKTRFSFNFPGSETGETLELDF
jgi:hypothetical protein